MADEIVIQLERLKPDRDRIPNKEDYFKVINEEYTKAYLGQLGINSNCDRNLYKSVARQAPLAQCNISAAWSDFSAVAETLRIEQPRIGPRPTPPSEGVAQAQVSADTSALKEEKIPDTRYMSAVPPELRKLQKVTPVDSLIGGQRAEAKAARDAAQQKAKLLETRIAEAMARSKREQPWSKAQATLTQELDQHMKKVRGSGTVGRIIEECQDDSYRAELEKLQQKYILPFACRNLEKSSDGDNGHGEEGPPVLWQLSTSVLPLQLPELLCEQALEPVTVTLEQIHEDTLQFAKERLPLKLLASRQEPALLAAAQEALSSMELSRLTGLVCHLLYWNMLGHLHPSTSRLPDSSKQAVEVTIHDLWATLAAPHRDSTTGVGFILPVILLVIKWSVERVFTTQYPQLFSTRTRAPGTKANSIENQLGRQLIEYINIICMLLLDPDCNYAHFSVLDSSPKAIRLWRKIGLLQASNGQGAATRMLTKSHRTTPLMQSLMGDRAGSADAKTRRLLNKSSSDARLRRTSSASSLADSQASCLDERKRSVLFAAAHRQLAHARPGSPALMEPAWARPRTRSADGRRAVDRMAPGSVQ